MHKLLCRTNSDIYLRIYLHFIPNKDYNPNCFKIINLNYLEHKKDKANLKQKSKKS